MVVYGRSFVIAQRHFPNFAVQYVIWAFQFSRSSIMTPRYLICSFLSNGESFNFNWMFIVCFFLCSRTKLVFPTFKDSRLDLNHELNLINSKLTSLSKVLAHLWPWLKHASSAKIRVASMAVTFGKSLIKTENRKGPRTLPWGTPHDTGRKELLCSFPSVYCLLFSI